MRASPQLFEVNAFRFLKRLRASTGGALTLAKVPDAEWMSLKERGFDLVWLMGVWRRSPGAVRKARNIAALQNEYTAALPGWTEEDVTGSPYAVYDYQIDPFLGDADALRTVRQQINRLGMGLILDFVPNHLALDHHWAGTFPERFVSGTPQFLANHPDWFYASDKVRSLAHGRDPYFAPWTDTAQVNFFSQSLRHALAEELIKITTVADGVRCDMAMLGLNAVFESVWGGVVGGNTRPATEFWADVIGAVRSVSPRFLFIAEAYWGLENKLQELGFDYTYDKIFYDAVRHRSAQDVHNRLREERIAGTNSVVFIENHDEDRAAAAMGRERSMAAAAVMSTVPGLRLYHEGQTEGKRIRVPVQLGAEPEEPIDNEIRAFYDRLLSISASPVYHEGNWDLMTAGPGWEGNTTHRNLLAWQWRLNRDVRLVVINFSSSPAQGRVNVQLPDWGSSAGTTIFHDELSNEGYTRDSSDLRTNGLYVALGPWRAHMFRFSNPF